METQRGYVVLTIKVADAERYRDYIALAPATVAMYGGKYLVRGGRTASLEGGQSLERVVLLEFESFDKAEQWWHSEAYRAPKLLRQGASTGNVFLVEGA